MTRKWLYWTTPLVLTVAACETDRTGEDGQFGDTSETTRAIDRPGETTDIGDRLGEGMRRTGEQVGEGARQTGERVTDTARETATDVRRQFGGGDEQQERPGAARTQEPDAGQTREPGAARTEEPGAARTQVPSGEYRLAAGQEPAGDPSQAEPKQAFARMTPVGGSQVSGAVQFKKEGDQIRVTGEIRGLPPGQHGLHVHEYGDLSDMQTGESAGDHFAPEGAPHGRPGEERSHVGDLGNIEADQQGVARIDVTSDKLKLSGPHSILGRALVVHEKEDQFTQPSGDAGGRLAMGIIGVGNPDAQPGEPGQQQPGQQQPRQQQPGQQQPGQSPTQQPGGMPGQQQPGQQPGQGPNSP